VLLQMLWQKQKQHQDWSLFCIPHMGDGQQAITLVTRVSDPITRVSDNYVTVSNADAKNELSNEINC
jgi:hypothetical protein